MATPRDARVSSVLAWTVDQREPEGRWLVADDRAGEVAGAFPEGTEVISWHRAAYDGVEASALPPEGPFDGIVLRLPRGNEAFRMAAHLLLSRLTPHGELIVGGANDEGIKPVAKRLEELVAETEVLATRRHCRVVAARSPRGERLRSELDDWSTEVRAEMSGVALAWRSWPSLFAHGRLDPGTRLLLEALPPLEGQVLDFACGPGPIGQFLQRRGDAIQLTLSDVDALAVHAARQNVPDAHVVVADGLPVEGGPWDAIVSNPPVHLGKDGTRGVLEALAATAPHRLVRGGALWIVVQGTVPVQRTLTDAFGVVERVTRNASYAVWRAEPARPRS